MWMFGMRSFKLALLIFAVLALASTAVAQININRLGPGGGRTGGGPLPPPITGCTNKLDFTQACNSQYAGAIL
jgi:hypothetical protein